MRETDLVLRAVLLPGLVEDGKSSSDDQAKFLGEGGSEGSGEVHEG